MPFYEYQCRHCGHELEVLQKISDGPLKKCPSCSRSKLERVISRVAFRLKGGGWYETDFKSDGENKRNLVGNDQGGGSAGVDPTAKAETSATDATKAASAETSGADKDSSGKADKPAATPAASPSASKDRGRAKAPTKTTTKTSTKTSATASTKTSKSAAKRPVAKTSTKRR